MFYHVSSSSTWWLKPALTGAQDGDTVGTVSPGHSLNLTLLVCKVTVENGSNMVIWLCHKKENFIMAPERCSSLNEKTISPGEEGKQKLREREREMSGQPNVCCDVGHQQTRAAGQKNCNLHSYEGPGCLFFFTNSYLCWRSSEILRILSLKIFTFSSE